MTNAAAARRPDFVPHNDVPKGLSEIARASVGFPTVANNANAHPTSTDTNGINTAMHVLFRLHSDGSPDPLFMQQLSRQSIRPQPLERTPHPVPWNPATGILRDLSDCHANHLLAGLRGETQKRAKEPSYRSWDVAGLGNVRSYDSLCRLGIRLAQYAVS